MDTRMETMLASFRATAADDDILIDGLLEAPAWGDRSVFSAADRLLALIPHSSGNDVFVGGATRRTSRSLREVVLRRKRVLRCAWHRLCLHARTKLNELHAGTLRVVSIRVRCAWVLSAQSRAFEHWRCVYRPPRSIGNEEMEAGSDSKAPQARRIIDLESELSELTTLADERQWLAQVLTKQLVREEDRNKHLAAQLGNALNRVPLSDDDDETKHKLEDGNANEEAGDAPPLTSRRLRPSRLLSLDAVFNSTVLPLPEGGVQLLNHLEGETEAAGKALLEQHSPGRDDDGEVKVDGNGVRQEPPAAHAKPVATAQALSRTGDALAETKITHAPPLDRKSASKVTTPTRRILAWDTPVWSQGTVAQTPLDPANAPVSLRKLSDAAVVAKHIVEDAPVQAAFAHYAVALVPLFAKFATKRVKGVQLLSENNWLRLNKSTGLIPTSVSAKSLRHFALCALTSNRNSTETTNLSFAEFSTGLGLVAIYVFREHQEEWSTREKVIALLVTMLNNSSGIMRPPNNQNRHAGDSSSNGTSSSNDWPVPEMPTPFLGPRLEGFLWRLFYHFGTSTAGGGSSSSSPRGKKLVPIKVLTNWGWAKLVKELLGGHLHSTEGQVHPDVMFNRFAHRQTGKLSFEAYLRAVTECDRILARTHAVANTENRGLPQQTPQAENEENTLPPLSNLLAGVSSANGFSAAPSSSREGR
mmetsp:Transcript_74872/g.150569  ORF Transcript_74872/g.150569 Transcript_74872/m.150569 type:complete len:701 (+) Transcript_74872:62-2164(+)